MPELRIDPLSGQRAIVAGERAGRPGGGFAVDPPPSPDPATDPFAEGNESLTPPEVFALREAGPADSPGWTVRVVPNLYPALDPDGGTPSPAPGPARGAPDLLVTRPATGAHEVVVNGPQPVATLHALGAEQLERAMGVWRERMRAHDDAAYVHVLVNEGRIAGASLPHTHAQLYALPFVPKRIARERERFTAHAERTQGRNLLEDLVQEEVRRGDRLVAVDPDAVVLCPFASRSPYQLQLVPRRPRARFEYDGPLGAGLLHDALGRLERVLGAPPPLNLWVRTAPRGAEWFCWRIDVVPRLTHMAGLELGAGIDVCIVPPEIAARELRDA